jgi:hypothetical protein
VRVDHVVEPRVALDPAGVVEQELAPVKLGRRAQEPGEPPFGDREAGRAERVDLLDRAVMEREEPATGFFSEPRDEDALARGVLPTQECDGARL